MVGKFESKRKLGKLRSGWIVNIKIHMKEIRQKGVDAIHLTLVRANGALYSTQY
jgi:hypothetical protein